MISYICNWSSYKGDICKKIVMHNNYCDIHCEMIKKFKYIHDDSEGLMCETFKTIKIIPRSHKHLITIMNNHGYTDEEYTEYVQVYLNGGSIEDADISNEDYIMLVSDDSQFYYKPVKGAYKANSLKVILNDYCKHSAIINYNDSNYCEECYKKLKGVPKVSLIKNNISENNILE